MQKFFIVFLAFVPIAIIAHLMQLSDTLVFFLCAVAIIPLAKFIGEATEELSSHTNAAVGGFLNATFGNATELIIGVFALHAGLVEVVKASITGSIIGNLLLVLGTAMLLGGSRHKNQKFNLTAAQANGSTLLLAVVALIIPAVFLWTSHEGNVHILQELSLFVSICMILVYVASLFFAMYTHKHLYTEEVGKYEARWSIKKSILILLAATLMVSWVSEILVGTIESVVAQFGWTEMFIGVIFVAIVGNIAEHISAITVAIKNRMDLSIQIAVGSATQIIMLVAPVLVIISWFVEPRMDLVFSTFELTAIMFSVFITNAVIADGESNWLEGVQLIMAYVIMGIAFFFYH